MKKLTSILLTAVLFFSTATLTLASGLSVSEDGTCLMDDTNYNPDKNCSWYLVNFIHMFDDWEGKVNPALSSSMLKIKNDKARQDASVRSANRNRINLINSPYFGK